MFGGECRLYPIAGFCRKNSPRPPFHFESKRDSDLEIIYSPFLWVQLFRNGVGNIPETLNDSLTSIHIYTLINTTLQTLIKWFS
jgi:hypothetical protein